MFKCPLSFPAPAAENFFGYIGLPVVLVETDGVTHLALWTDPTDRPLGVIEDAEDRVGGLCSVVVQGRVPARVGTAALQAGAHRAVRCIAAGATDDLKARITALTGGAGHYSLGDFLETEDVAAGGMAWLLVHPSNNVVA